MEVNQRKAKPTAADIAAAARLKAIWDARARELKLTQDLVAEELGITQGAVSQYLNGKIPMNYRTLVVFCRALRIDETEIRADLPEQRLLPVVANDEPNWDDITAYAQAVGLGNGAEAQEYADTHKLKFKTSSLRKRGIFGRSLAVYYGRGDSMEPTIKDGDAIMFDTSDTRPTDDALFVVQVGHEVYVKRAEVLDDAVYFRSDNPRGDHQWRKARRMDSKKDPITILGRVHWIGAWVD